MGGQEGDGPYGLSSLLKHYMDDYSAPQRAESGTTAQQIHTHSQIPSIDTRGEKEGPTDYWSINSCTTMHDSTDQNFPKRYTPTETLQGSSLCIWFLHASVRTMRQVTTPALRGDCAILVSPHQICRSALLLGLRCHQPAVPSTGIQILILFISLTPRTIEIQES